MGSNISCFEEAKDSQDRRRSRHPKDLILLHDRAVTQGKLIDGYISSLSARMASQAPSGHISLGLLLIQRKCIAESVRQTYMRYAYQKYRQIALSYSRAGLQVQPMSRRDYLTDEFQATDIAMGMSREYNLFHRSC